MANRSTSANAISGERAEARIATAGATADATINGTERSLAGMISDAPVDPRSVVPIFIQILDCLEATYAKGRSHVPLTPAAIRVSGQGRAEIRSYAPEETRGTVIFGSGKYAAPEAFRRRTEAQACAEFDSYILGFIFYELFVGNKLFRKEFAKVDASSDSGWLTWHANESERARPLTQVIPGFPRIISEIVLGMLQKDPARRNKDLIRISEALQSTIDKTVVATKFAMPGTAPNRANINVPIRDSAKFLLALITHCRHWWTYITTTLSNLVFTPSKALVKNQIKLFLQRVSRISVHPRWYVSFPALVFLALTIWFWRSATVDHSYSSASLPATILTDSGEMVLVPAREIRLSTPEAQRGSSYLSPFYMDRYEVTNRRYWDFCRATGRTFPENPSWDEHYSEWPDGPVLNVSKSEAVAFARWAGKWVPSEFEWRVAMSAPGQLFRPHSAQESGVHTFELIAST
jgi:serine/threonine protein kinase